MSQGIMGKKLINSIAQAIYDKKGFNIVALDVRGISTMTDYFIIAEGTVERHVKALTQVASEAVEENGIRILHQEGVRTGDWAVLDCGDIVIHLFIPELREKYSLEQVWREGSIVDLTIKTEVL